MDEAVRHINASGLSPPEKGRLRGILLADNNLASGINVIHDDVALRELINLKSGKP